MQRQLGAFGWTVATAGVALGALLLLPAAGSAQVELGTVEGTVTIRNLPLGIAAGGWVHVCLASDDFEPGCEGQVFSPTNEDGSFSIELAPGQWYVAAGYREFHPSGPRPVLGSPVVATVVAGEVTVRNLLVDYQPSGIVQGTLTVTGLPPGLQVNRGVFACRAEETFELYCPSWAFDVFFGDEGYSLSLLPGDWRIAASYNDGRDVIAPPVDFHLDGGKTLTLDLEIAFDPSLGPPPPPPPPVPTLAPPVAPTTTSTLPTAPHQPPVDPSSAVAATTTPRLARAGRALAFTGSSMLPLLAVATAMILGGVLCVAMPRFGDREARRRG